MRIFSLDTSFSFFNFSIVESGRVKLIYFNDSERKTLENLPKVLEDQGIDLGSFDAFAVSRGVGYLTALRIGVTFIKTAAYLLNKPVVSYENLYLLCRYVPGSFPRVAYLQISNYVFYRYARDENTIGDVKIFEGEELEAYGITLRSVTEKRIVKRTYEMPFFPFSAYGGIYASEVLKENGEGENLFLLEPLYLRPPV